MTTPVKPPPDPPPVAGTLARLKREMGDGAGRTRKQAERGKRRRGKRERETKQS